MLSATAMKRNNGYVCCDATGMKKCAPWEYESILYSIYSVSAKYKCTYICITTINVSMYKQICVIIMQATNKILTGGNVLHVKQRAVCAQTAWRYLKAKKKKKTGNTTKEPCMQPYSPTQLSVPLNTDCYQLTDKIAKVFTQRPCNYPMRHTSYLHDYKLLCVCVGRK